MSLRFRIVVVLLATLTLLLTSCDSGEQQLADVPDNAQMATETETLPENVATQLPEEPSDFDASLRVLNQLGDGERVVVSGASTEGGFRAFAVVYDDAHDTPGEPLGFAPIDKAQEGSVTVELDEPITETGAHKLWVVVHIDTAPEGEFDPGTDRALTIDGETLRDDFTYTVTSS